MPGTLGALQPFFSPDSQSVGFFSESDLMAVGVGGGPATAIASSADIRGGAWGSDGSIVVGHSGAPTSGLVLVPADGGEPEVLTSPTPPGDSYRFPQYLPGGRRILFTHETAESDTRADKRSAVYSLDDETVRTLPHRGTHFRYLPTGHLIYGRGGGLAAVPFDVEALEATGPERMVMAGVAIEPDIGAVDASVSDTGHLIFLTAIDSEGWLAWIDPDGAMTPLYEERAPYQYPRLSPDGTRIGLGLQEDIWFYEIERQTLDRLALEGNDNLPEWSLDGQRIIYSSNRDGSWRGWVKRADDRSPGEPLPFESPAINDAVVVHPDGETVAMAAGNDIWVVPAGGELLQFTDNPAIEVAPRFSPDGRWLAYVSNEQGSDHVYAQAFPGPGRRWLVSPRGGFEPVWAPDGRRLLFREGLGFFAVAVDSAATSPFGLPEALFEANVVRGRLGGCQLRCGRGRSARRSWPPTWT